jgi:uncharacterized cupredoxin-like copper-binding protein
VNSLPVALTEPQFVVMGGLFAVWAVVLAFAGLRRHNFPANQAGERAVMAISALLLAGAIGTAIGFAKNGPKGGQVGKETIKAPVQTLQLAAAPGTTLKFNKSSLQAKAGGVKIVLKNPSTLQHNVSIQGNGVNVVGGTANGGGTTQVEAKLKPGTYTFYCNVPGHRQAGMQGTLTVK